MSNLTAETRLSYVQAAEACGVHPNTISNWTRLGVDGVYLENYRVGGRFFTTSEALARFNAALEEVGR